MPLVSLACVDRLLGDGSASGDWRLISATDAASSSAPAATACMLEDAWVEALGGGRHTLRGRGNGGRDLAEIVIDGFLQIRAADAVLDLGRDVGRELDDLHDLAVGILDRIVGCLNPDRPAALSDPLVFGRLIFAAPQRFPERPVGRASRSSGSTNMR